MMASETPEISLQECERCFAFLQTILGETFLQTCYEEREEQRRISKPTTSQRKLLKLSEVKKHQEWETHKSEIFFLYMRNFSSAGILREITSAGHRFASQSPRTCDNRLEGWGLPLNPEFRKTFTTQLRTEAAAWDGQLQLNSAQYPFQVIPEAIDLVADPDFSHDSYENILFGFVDSPTLGATKDKTPADKRQLFGGRIPYPTITQDLTPNDQIPPIDLTGFSLDISEELNKTYFPTGEPSLVGKAASLLSAETPSWNSNEDQDGADSGYVNPSLLTKPSSILRHDDDSGFYSMEVEKASCIEMEVDSILEETTATAGDYGLNDSFQEEMATPVGDYGLSDPRPESPDKAYYELFDANSMIPSKRTSLHLLPELDTKRGDSILFTIPCRSDHKDVALGKQRACACGVTQVHAICICWVELPDHQLSTILGHVLNKDEIDGAGNTPLHYLAAAGRYEIFDYMLDSGIDPTRLNTMGQSFLHVLDASRFSDTLIDFLKAFKESGLLELRDRNGRTVLHGVLRNPILPEVYHDLVDFYGPGRAIQFAVRDNRGLYAAQHIRNVAQTQNPHASYGHVGYAQAIVVYENISSRYMTDTAVPNNAIQDMQNRLAVLRHSNPSTPNSKPNAEDCSGRNALHCLVSTPRACSFEDSKTRLNQLEQYIFFGSDINHYDHAGRTPLLASIIDSTSVTDESVIKIAVELLCQNGANVHNRDRDGHTALYHAIRKGYCDCVAVLLQHGAHINRRAPDGRSYRRIAQDYLQFHLSASDQDGFDRLQKRLAVVSAITAYRAKLEPTVLEAWGVDAT